MKEENKEMVAQKNILLKAVNKLNPDSNNKKSNVTSIDLQTIYDIINSEKIVEISRIVLVEKITRNKLRGLIGRWFPPCAGGMTIKEVINDMYFRINHSVEGRVDYCTGNTAPPVKRGIYVYVLIIKRGNILFVDDNKRICYVIK